ncbi:hypothetical protein H4R33_003838 [Dimargaris cristalligena]|uniref:Lish and RanBPM domain-containing protein n=1 Tax=Dimargaris cristalligena TaxID=215637 RepID=A0A4P9ZXK4_9FUNG|nr:hypothetical protein H4R33_003838 [Dimargaris cristalligena]RKP38404.1 lish and RanBPM domain-containing protein [Dimargaris cristalligena]|eukprot:RKP38404.1 lish and RanBPM domain-containing protein [Dimargaris cristalligena]
MTAPTPPKTVISFEDWQQRLNSLSFGKSELNQLIMDYLIIEGYKDAAEKFSEECGLQPDVDLNFIEERMKIRFAVQTGNIEEAIERVNDLNPQILDTNPQLYFHLQQQRLIELIREGKVEEALLFAQEEMAPRGEEVPELLDELEKTMTLLAFDPALNFPSPVSELLDYGQRQKIASELNAAILSAESYQSEPKLPSIIKLLTWAQTQLDARASYPHLTNILTGEIDHSSSPSDEAAS